MEILEHYVEQRTYKSREEDKPQWIIDQLSVSQQEVAAEANYSYWCWKRKQEQQQKQQRQQHEAMTGDDDELSTVFRLAAARKEAERHMDGIDCKEKALGFLLATIRFRIERQINLYRTCMAIDQNKGVAVHDRIIDSDHRLLSLRRNRIEQELQHNQTFVVRGHDKDGRAMLLAFPRKQSGTDHEAFLDVIVYLMERAIACTEFLTKGKADNKIVVVLDTQGSASPPSMSAAKQCVQILQTHYPGRLHALVVLNPPMLLYAMYKCLQPFLDPDTCRKFVFCKGDGAQRHKILGNKIDPAQAMPHVLPGSGKLSSKIDWQRFLYHVPFHCLYDDDNHSVVDEHIEARETATSK